jgi:hypothetical protein
MKVSGWQYLWGTIVLLTLYCMTSWWELRMLLISIAGALAITYSATNEEEDNED